MAWHHKCIVQTAAVHTHAACSAPSHSMLCNQSSPFMINPPARLVELCCVVVGAAPTAVVDGYRGHNVCCSPPGGAGRGAVANVFGHGCSCAIPPGALQVGLGGAEYCSCQCVARAASRQSCFIRRGGSFTCYQGSQNSLAFYAHCCTPLLRAVPATLTV